MKVFVKSEPLLYYSFFGDSFTKIEVPADIGVINGGGTGIEKFLNI